jgi:hypothetical protein
MELNHGLLLVTNIFRLRLPVRPVPPPPHVWLMHFFAGIAYPPVSVTRACPAPPPWAPSPPPPLSPSPPLPCCGAQLLYYSNNLKFNIELRFTSGP